MKATCPQSFRLNIGFHLGRNELETQNGRRTLFLLHPIICHHSKLIMSWKLSLRKTAELGFYSTPLSPFPPPPFRSSPLSTTSFSHACTDLRLYQGPVCNSLFLRPYLRPLLLHSFSLATFSSSCSVSLFTFPVSLVFHC